MQTPPRDITKTTLTMLVKLHIRDNSNSNSCSIARPVIITREYQLPEENHPLLYGALSSEGLY